MEDKQAVSQSVVARSSTEAKYRSIVVTCCEVPWLLHLFKDLGVKKLILVTLRCDNQAALYITANPVFHEKTEHIEVDCYLLEIN